MSIWLNDLSQERLTSGILAHLVAHDHVSGVTTNSSIFAKGSQQHLMICLVAPPHSSWKIKSRPSYLHTKLVIGYENA